MSYVGRAYGGVRLKRIWRGPKRPSIEEGSTLYTAATTLALVRYG